MKRKVGKITAFAAALGGAAILLAPGAVRAQEGGPVYLTPKLMYSHQMTDNFKASESFEGFGNFSGRYSGSNESGDTFGGGLAVGYDFGAAGGVPVRAELEYLIRGRSDTEYPTKRTSYLNAFNYSDSSYESQATVQTLFANFYYDFRNDTAFTPYIGAGLGGANVKGELKSKHRGTITHYPSNHVYPDVSTDFNGSHESWNFAWNLSAGAAYQFTDSIALDLSYRYSDMGAVEYGTHWYTLVGATDVITGDTDMGHYGGKAEADLTAHEVILGLRISAF